jgi:hypothetical protein
MNVNDGFPRNVPHLLQEVVERFRKGKENDALELLDALIERVRTHDRPAGLVTELRAVRSGLGTGYGEKEALATLGEIRERLRMSPGSGSS